MTLLFKTGSYAKDFQDNFFNLLKLSQIFNYLYSEVVMWTKMKLKVIKANHFWIDDWTDDFYNNLRKLNQRNC